MIRKHGFPVISLGQFHDHLNLLKLALILIPTGVSDWG